MHFRTTIALALLLVVGLLSARQSMSQPDPFWLESWNEAQRTRPAEMTSAGRIASANEPGVPLHIQGQIVEPDGRTPARDVVVHAYHRDHDGFDFGKDDRELTTWRLQGWAVTDEQGRFEFRTIRPAPDHMGRDGSHIHITVESSEFGRQWAPTVYFSDDPLVKDQRREQSAEAGEFGWVRDVTTINGVQHTTVRIKLKSKADF